MSHKPSGPNNRIAIYCSATESTVKAARVHTNIYGKAVPRHVGGWTWAPRPRSESDAHILDLRFCLFAWLTNNRTRRGSQDDLNFEEERQTQMARAVMVEAAQVKMTALRRASCGSHEHRRTSSASKSTHATYKKTPAQTH